jgi:hypothetical protein
MRFLPVFLDTAAGVAVVIGAGEPALGKLRLLRAAGGRVRWFPGAADVAEEMPALSGASPLEINLADPLEADWSDAVAVVSAAGDRSMRKSPRARGACAFRSTSSIGRSSRASFFPPSSIAARSLSRSAPAGPPRFWRGVCAS